MDSTCEAARSVSSDDTISHTLTRFRARYALPCSATRCNNFQ